MALEKVCKRKEGGRDGILKAIALRPVTDVGAADKLLSNWR